MEIKVTIGEVHIHIERSAQEEKTPEDWREMIGDILREEFPLMKDWLFNFETRETTERLRTQRSTEEAGNEIPPPLEFG